MSAASDWQAEFIDRVGAVAEVSGMPPSVTRVFAWLIVCEPPQQSVEQMRHTLGLSSGAISMATSALGRMGLVERVVLPGQRRLYYRFHSGGWEQMLRVRIEAASTMREIAEDALAQVDQPPQRLAEMRDMYARFETLMAGMATRRPRATGSRR